MAKKKTKEAIEVRLSVEEAGYAAVGLDLLVQLRKQEARETSNGSKAVALRAQVTVMEQLRDGLCEAIEGEGAKPPPVGDERND